MKRATVVSHLPRVLEKIATLRAPVRTEPFGFDPIVAMNSKGTTATPGLVQPALPRSDGSLVVDEARVSSRFRIFPAVVAGTG